MARRELSQTVIVMDLDDTLYPEEAYVRSGMQHICEQLESLFGISASQAFEVAVRLRESDWIEALRIFARLPVSAKESLLWMYRLHIPAIQMSEPCARFLERMQSDAAAVVVLTDGRTITQQLKLQALGLSHLHAYISEHYESEKPEVARFHAIERDYPASAYVYVGDNPKKDFLAGNVIGWTTIGLRGKSNIHSQNIADVPCSALPHYWISSWDDIYTILC